MTSTRLERAIVRSRATLSYAEAQARIDARRRPTGCSGSCSEVGLAAHRAGTGARRREPQLAREPRSCAPPTAATRSSGDGLLPVEDWNAQLSLMTGMAAAELMLEARVGILRTMPAPDAERIAAFRAQTEALGRPWPVVDLATASTCAGSIATTRPRSRSCRRPAACSAAPGYEAFDGTCRATPCSPRSPRRTRT